MSGASVLGDEHSMGGYQLRVQGIDFLLTTSPGGLLRRLSDLIHRSTVAVASEGVCHPRLH
jgi:hypothetical protein